jgi:chorismate mutase
MVNCSIFDIRRQFDDIDKSILILLATRTQLSKEMALQKKSNNMPVVQTEIWEQQLNNRKKENDKLKVDSVFIDKIFSAIHDESIRIQNQELDNLK